LKNAVLCFGSKAMCSATAAALDGSLSSMVWCANCVGDGEYAGRRVRKVERCSMEEQGAVGQPEATTTMAMTSLVAVTLLVAVGGRHPWGL
jgi:hypothetical protein